MAYIKIDFDKIDRDFLPKINDSISKLDELISVADSTKIPERFCHANYFRNYVSDLKETRRIYSEKRELIVSCNDAIKKILESVEDNLYNIKTIRIKKRGKLF